MDYNDVSQVQRVCTACKVNMCSAKNSLVSCIRICFGSAHFTSRNARCEFEILLACFLNFSRPPPVLVPNGNGRRGFGKIDNSITYTDAKTELKTREKIKQNWNEQNEIIIEDNNI